RDQLSGMAKQARSAMDADKLTVVADRGYFKGEEILTCHQADITTFLPRPQTSGSKAKGRFGKQDFHYLAEDDEYLCPAGERLGNHFTSVENGLNLHVYWSSACQGCAIKAQCTTGKERRIKRWEHEGVLDAMQERLDRDPDKMRVRRETVEHPFGTIKGWMGATHFLTRTLDRVGTEMSLHVLAYNLKRVMNIVGVLPLIEVMQA
ncbi:MAG: transposase, partial [Acidiferrobacterales bacterium]